MWKKIRNIIYDSCDILELVMAFVVLIAILVAAASLWHPFVAFVESRFESEALLVFVGHVFNILIGIEFLKMLSHPSSDTVLEVLTFLVARHMVIEQTTVWENIISILSIALLFAMKKYLNLPTNKESTDIFVTEYDWDKLKEKRKKHKEKKEQLLQEQVEQLTREVERLKGEDTGK